MGMITKVLSIGFAVIVLLVGSLTHSDEKAAEAAREIQTQAMEIACHHCHRNITVDISKDSAVCTYCHEVNEFDG